MELVGSLKILVVCLQDGEELKNARRAGLSGLGIFAHLNVPVQVGQGDCDTDADCAAGLFCTHNVGARYGRISQMDVCEIREMIATPSITRVSPRSGTSNDKITIHGRNLASTTPSGITIEFLRNGVMTGSIGGQHVFTKPDMMSLEFQLIGLLVGNLEPGMYQIRIVNDHGASNAVNFTIVRRVFKLQNMVDS